MGWILKLFLWLPKTTTGRTLENIRGFSYIEILEDWVQTNFEKETLVILTDINLVGKPSTFWDTIPYEKKVMFTRDIVILKCKDYSHMEQILDSIQGEFAIAWGFQGGKLVGCNDNKRY